MAISIDIGKPRRRPNFTDEELFAMSDSADIVHNISLNNTILILINDKDKFICFQFYIWIVIFLLPLNHLGNNLSLLSVL